METISFKFCINDPDNGMDTGRAIAFDFGGLIHVAGNDVSFKRIDKGTMKIHKRLFPILGYGSWLGNWCWDGATVSLETANSIAAYLRDELGFKCEDGLAKLFDAWNDGGLIDFTTDVKLHRSL